MKRSDPTICATAPRPFSMGSALIQIWRLKYSLGLMVMGMSKLKRPALKSIKSSQWRTHVHPISTMDNLRLGNFSNVPVTHHAGKACKGVREGHHIAEEHWAQACLVFRI